MPVTKTRTYKKKSKEERAAEKKRMNDLLEAKNEEVFFESDNLAAFLKFVSKFTKYSYNNQLLIFSQFPNASFVSTYNGWKNKGRYVKANEKGIEIFKPCPKKIERNEKDENGNLVLDENGEPKKKIVSYMDYTIDHVFDISQTDGKSIDEMLSISDEDPLYETSEDLCDALKSVTAGISYDMQPYDMIMAAARENLQDPSREAIEACAHILSGYLQIDIGKLPSDIIEWAKGKTGKELFEFMRNVNGASKKIINQLEAGED